MKELLLFFIFTLFSNYSYSQSDENFVYIGSNTENFKHYVYKEKVNSLSIDAWIKTIEPTKTVKNKKGKYVKTGGRYSLTFVSMNCSTREYDITQEVTYNIDGKVISSNDFPKYGKKVIPGSIMTSVCDYLCSEEE